MSKMGKERVLLVAGQTGRGDWWEELRQASFSHFGPEAPLEHEQSDDAADVGHLRLAGDDSSIWRTGFVDERELPRGHSWSC